MDVKTINDLLESGEIDRDDMWPKKIELESKAISFFFEFGLKELPREPGVITVRGPRQYGKSTWLEQELYYTIKDYGKGTAYYLNGDEILNTNQFYEDLTSLVVSFHKNAEVKRVFVDEVTAIHDWEKAIKRLSDQGKLKDVLIITTGSKATDLRRGSERLPGRKGRLKKTDYLFLPIPYKQFYHQVKRELNEKQAVIAYLLTGGSPLALNDIYQFEHIPEYYIQLIKDWIYGEIISSGRQRLFVSNLIKNIFHYGGQPLGFAKLARESGMANNTVASGYIEQLSDLLCLMPAWSIDENKKILKLNKPCKFHFINLASVVAFYPSNLRYVHEFNNLDSQEQGKFYEWLVAQEVWRRSVLNGVENPESLGFWQSKTNEIDFVTPDFNFIEVKRGKASALDFAWFPKTFPNKKLTVICETPFQTNHIKAMTMHDFLMDFPSLADEWE